MTRRLIALAAALILAAGGAVARAPVLTVSDTRPFGYFLGDAVQREVTLRVGPGDVLDTASLPRPGPLNYWLELSRADITSSAEGDDTIYRLALTYHTFYAPLDTRRLTIPAFKLKISGTTDAEITVPEFGFVTSPIRQLFADKGQSSDTATKLRPDWTAPRIATGGVRTAMLASGMTALAALAGLAWLNAWWPFHRRPARPFTEAARFLRSNVRRLDGATGYRVALLKLHRAFDIAAGRRVLADDVGAFLALHPEFAPFRSDVERMFASSRQAFFANEVDQARETMPLSALSKLGDHLGAAERRAA
jgi:mxaA protein